MTGTDLGGLACGLGYLLLTALGVAVQVLAGKADPPDDLEREYTAERARLRRQKGGSP